MKHSDKILISFRYVGICEEQFIEIKYMSFKTLMNYDNFIKLIK